MKKKHSVPFLQQNWQSAEQKPKFTRTFKSHQEVFLLQAHLATKTHVPLASQQGGEEQQYS